jgi:beta-ureidopropionase
MSTRARIATVCQAGQVLKTVEENRNQALGLLDLALKQGADLVCLPETFPHKWRSGKLPDLAETVPGPTIDAVAKRAREHKCYVICPIVTVREDRRLNSAVVIGRDGSVLGIYDKLQPVTSSPDYTVFEDGLLPGSELPVFDLDFGRVGVQICFDAGFPEHWQALADKGVRAVFWPSAYDGGFPLQAFAALHHYWVISAVGSSGARFIDPLGTVRASTDSLKNVIWQDVNLDFVVCHTDFNYAIGDRIYAARPGKVDIRTDTASGWFLVEPTDPSVTVAQLQQEFGFETRQQYFQRHRDAYARLRKGEKPVAQTGAHGNRPMYTK